MERFERKRTWTNSTRAESPRGLETDTLVAGYALGVMVTELRFRGLVMAKEVMLTMDKHQVSDELRAWGWSRFG